MTSFDRFWSAYPSCNRKVARKKCMVKWQRINPSPELVDKIVRHLEVMKNDESWIKGFIPMPFTYLNQERWEAFIEDEKKKVAKECSICHGTGWIEQPDRSMSLCGCQLSTIDNNIQ